MANQQTLEGRVNEDLRLDGSPLTIEEYSDFIKENFLYYTFNHAEEPGRTNRNRYYDKRREISQEEYDSRVKEGEEGVYMFHVKEDGSDFLNTANIGSNIRHRKTPQLNKFREYLEDNYPSLFVEYLRLGKHVGEINVRVFDLFNTNREEAMRLQEENQDASKTYTAHIVKALLILRNYNQIAKPEDKVTMASILK